MNSRKIQSKREARKTNQSHSRNSFQRTQHRAPNHQLLNGVEEECQGVLELHPKGYGFLRSSELGLPRRDTDVFVPESLISKHGLLPGAMIKGQSQTGPNRKSGPRLIRVESIESMSPQQFQIKRSFDEGIPVNPSRLLRLERSEGPVSTRVLDLFCPIGLGQRALIASPPRAGKTTLLRQIGASISENHPDIELVALLIDERPEEVTDLRSELRGQVYASCLDQDVQSHARLSQLVIERCKRMVESGRDVFLIVDSLTRMSRAFNKLPNLNGPTGAGGLNIRALDMPKQVFAAARSLRGGGSLTIVATVLIETENRMDEVIFQEFKGTGNFDLVLDQWLAERRIWPAIDIKKSGTRRVELLQDPETLRAVTALRRSMMAMPQSEALQELTAKLQRFPSNPEFVAMINRQLQ